MERYPLETLQICLYNNQNNYIHFVEYVILPRSTYKSMNSNETLTVEIRRFYRGYIVSNLSVMFIVL